MRIGLGIGIGFVRGRGAAIYVPVSYPISPALWTNAEAPADADTRKTRIRVMVPPQIGMLIGGYRGTDPAGNLSQIATLPYVVDGYDWTSTGRNGYGAPVYSRLAIRPADLSAPWAWLSGPADTKYYQASDIPSAPTGSWAALSSGVVRVTLGPWNGQRRAVTGGQYQIGTGAWVDFVAAAAGATTVVDVTGLTDGVATATNFRWVNANVDATHLAGVLSMDLIAQSVEPVPGAPNITYLVDGSGTSATVYFDIADAIPPGITSVRYRVGAGSSVVVSGSGPIALTGLSASQSFEAEWANSTGYSATTTITLQAALPTYAAGDWSISDAATIAGDGLNLTISAHPTAPAGMERIGTQWSSNAGTTWHDFTTSPIATGVPNTAATVILRPVYDIGPGIASASKSATPTYAVPVTSFPSLNASQVVTTTGSTSSTASRSVAFPAHTTGQRLFAVLATDGNPGFTVTESGWTAVKVTENGSTDGNLWYFTKIAASNSEALTLTPTAAEQFILHAWAIDGSRSMLVGTPVDVLGGVSSVDINVGNLSFGGATEKATCILAMSQRADYTAPTGAPPDSYSSYLASHSAADGAGARICSAYKQVEATGFDPSSWPEVLRGVTCVLFAFLPVAATSPVTSLSVTPSATAIELGESITFTMSADGQTPVTYSLTFDGSTTSNTTGIFTRTPTAGTKAWSATATNVAGLTATASGSISVQAQMAFTVDATNPFLIVAQANSVSHDVTPSTYEMEVQTAPGVAVASLPAQASPNFSINFPASGAYRFRARAIASGGALGTWSAWFYYWVQQVGSVQFFGENAQAVQISPLSVQAPVEVVPVSGKSVKLHAPRPALQTENLTDAAGTTRTHYLNGVWVNPSAYSGRGPHAWDSRKGGRNSVGSWNGKFDPSLLQTTWPVAMPVNSTLVKALSRPTALLEAGDQGTRFGVIDQHAGIAVVSSLSTTSPMQAAPALIKHGTWSPGSVSLPGYQAMADAITASSLSTSGMSPPAAADVIAKVCRFNPTAKLLRGGSWFDDDNECLAPYRSSFGSTNTNYYAYQAYAVAYCMMLSDAATSDQKIALLQSEILRGLQTDFPNNDARVGAGISQDYMAPVALSRIARGQNFADLATTQRENAPHQYGYWDSTRLSYLNAHNSLTLPTFALRRQVQSVLADDGIGTRFTVAWNNNTKTGEMKQRFAGLNIVRESTGQELPFRGPDYDKANPSTTFSAVGFFSTALTVGEWIYLKIPASAMTGFVTGEPFWMYDTEGYGASMVWDWQSYNPTPGMSYRNLQDPHGGIMILHALGAYPSTAGSSWQAMKDYTLKTAQANWPASGFKYGFTAGGFVGSFWHAHAATLGITL